MMQVVALAAPSAPHAADRVGHARSGGVRVYAPADLPREATLRWAARHATQAGADLQVLVDPPHEGARPAASTVGLLVETAWVLGARVLDLVPYPSLHRLAARLAGAAAGVRVLVLPAALPELDQVVAAAPGPVVVVPDRPLLRLPAPVVLGLGPDTGPPVVGFAFEVAARSGARLLVVRAGDDVSGQDCRDVLAAWRLAHPEVDVEVDVWDVDPEAALRAPARSAALLVVGRPSRGRLGRWTTGSPVSALLRRPPCPVAVVPDRPR